MGVEAKLMTRLQQEARHINASPIALVAIPLKRKERQFYKSIGARIDRFEGERPFDRWALSS